MSRKPIEIIVSLSAIILSAMVGIWLFSTRGRGPLTNLSQPSNFNSSKFSDPGPSHLSAEEALEGIVPVITYELDPRSGIEEPVAIIHGKKRMGRGLLDGGAEIVQLREVLENRLINGTLIEKDIETYAKYILVNTMGEGPEAERNFLAATSLLTSLVIPSTEIKFECAPEVLSSLDSLISDALLHDNSTIQSIIMRAAWTRGSVFRNPKVVERLKIIRDDVSSPRDARRADDILKAMERRLAEAAQGGSDVSKP